MSSEGISGEFRELQSEIRDSDPIVRGMAAIELGSFAIDHPEYKDRIIVMLEDAVLHDSNEDVRQSAQNSLAQLRGEKEFVVPGQVIGFGYLPEEHRQPEVDQKQMIISCVCCIIMIVTISLMMIYFF
jgi:hypothetical protein